MSIIQPDPSQEIAMLYNEHHSWLQSWLMKKLGNLDDAQDISHDTFIRILKRHCAKSSLGAEPRALLTHIAKALVIDHWRKQGIERAYLEVISQLPEAEVPSAESQYLILEALYQADEMLKSLPALTREVFLTAQLENVSYQQVADQFGISLITVKRHMRKAFYACLSLS